MEGISKRRVRFWWGWAATPAMLVDLLGYFWDGIYFRNCKNMPAGTALLNVPSPPYWRLGKSQLSLLKSRLESAFFSINCWMEVLMDPNSAS